MIIFNTTFHTEDDIHDDFLTFLKEIYIIQAMDSGFLHEPRLAKIYAQHETSGRSYSLQFKVKNVDTLNHWLSNGGQVLQKELNIRFGSKAAGFITLLEEMPL